MGGFGKQRDEGDVGASFGFKRDAKVSRAFKFWMLAHTWLLRKQCNISLCNAKGDIEKALII